MLKKHLKNLMKIVEFVCVPSPARRDASVAGEPGAPLDMLLSTAGEPGPRSIRLSSVASFSTCR